MVRARTMKQCVFAIFLFNVWVLPGCFSDKIPEDVFLVQDSSTKIPEWTIDINRVRNSVYRSYAPRCLDTVRIGQTLEFRNFMPDVPSNVSSIAGPSPLYSPNLIKPYNLISETDASNTLCDVHGDVACAKRPTWSYWRHTFTKPGVYDWLDTNQSTPGRKIIDPYYGTVTYVGMDPNTPFGTVCVTNDDETGCENVCCVKDQDCKSGETCFKKETESIGRCLSPS